MFPPTSRAHLYENLIMKIERVNRYIVSRQNKIDRALTGRPELAGQTDFRKERFECARTAFSPSYLFISHDCRESRLSETIVATDPFVTKICYDPRRKFALAAELQEGRVGRNEDLSRPYRKENTSRHV